MLGKRQMPFLKCIESIVGNGTFACDEQNFNSPFPTIISKQFKNGTFILPRCSCLSS